MGHVQDSPVATTMISNECMIYHMKEHIVSYNLDQIFFSKSKIHILTISGPMSIKPAIVEAFGKTLFPAEGAKWNTESVLYSQYVNCQ